MFVLGKLFLPSLMFVGKAEANLSGAPSGTQPIGRLLALLVNIRLGWKDLIETNTLAY